MSDSFKFTFDTKRLGKFLPLRQFKFFFLYFLINETFYFSALIIYLLEKVLQASIILLPIFYLLHKLCCHGILRHHHNIQDLGI